jgi:hypothetical protein
VRTHVCADVGNEFALLHELTASNARGVLRNFLSKIAAKQSQHAMLSKFTELAPDGTRRFVHNEGTKLRPAEPEAIAALRASWSASGYGASLLKIGWNTFSEWSAADRVRSRRQIKSNH